MALIVWSSQLNALDNLHRKAEDFKQSFTCNLLKSIYSMVWLVLHLELKKKILMGLLNNCSIHMFLYLRQSNNKELLKNLF